jgi:hypothetical protein
MNSVSLPAVFAKIGLTPAIGDDRRIRGVSPTSMGDTGAI